MGTKIGLWIDHRKAVIMSIAENGGESKLTLTNAETQPRGNGRASLKGMFGRLRFSTDTARKRNFREHLDMYYDSVIACIKDAEFIFILGPGEAKNELKGRLEEKKLGDRINGIEAASLMTARQLEAKIRKYFAW